MIKMDEYNPKKSEDWNRLLGFAWTKMLKSFRLNPSGTVVEIGPGFAEKIAYGLAGIGFCGTVILVEPNSLAGTWAKQKYHAILPKAEIIHLQQSIRGLMVPDKLVIDALVANHILDDLLLNASLSEKTSASIFERMRPNSSCSPKFICRWRELFEDIQFIEYLIIQVAGEISSLIDKIQPHLLILSHYPSWKQNSQNLNLIYKLTLQLMQRLEANIGATCINTRDVSDGDHECMVRWLIRDYDVTKLDSAK